MNHQFGQKRTVAEIAGESISASIANCAVLKAVQSAAALASPEKNQKPAKPDIIKFQRIGRGGRSLCAGTEMTRNAEFGSLRDGQPITLNKLGK